MSLCVPGHSFRCCGSHGICVYIYIDICIIDAFTSESEIKMLPESLQSISNYVLATALHSLHSFNPFLKYACAPC